MGEIRIVGLASSAGALFEGTESAPQAIRQAGLVNALKKAGHTVKDIGDLADSSGMPRHNIAPIRNWPAPRMIWEKIITEAEAIFEHGAFTIILGGDCSIEVGTFTAFRKIYGDNSHLLVLDGHIDTVEPEGNRCIGAAGMGLWFLTQDREVWWTEKPVSRDQVSIIGPHNLPGNDDGIKIIPLKDIQQPNAIEIISEHLQTIPADSKLLVHLDVDILHKSIMPAAYSPSEEGLNRELAITLMKRVLADPRVMAIEVTEFSANKDDDGKCAQMIVELLSFAF